MEEGGRGRPAGSLRVPRIRYRSRLSVLVLLSVGVLSALWQVYNTRQLWEDTYLGLVDLRVLAVSCWFWLTSLFRVICRWILGAVGRFGACRLLTLLVFYGVAATALSAFFTGSLNDHAWKWFVRINFIEKLEQNIVKVDDGREVSVRVEPHPVTKGKYAPHLLETFERYNGEDVRFTCEYNFTALENAILHSGMVLWVRSNVSVNVTSRHFVNTTLVKLDKSRTDQENNSYYGYSFRSELRIYLLNETDFGDYSCLVYKDYHLKEPPEKARGKRTSSSNTTKASRTLRRRECPPCRFEAVRPLQEILAALKCFSRTVKDMNDFQNRLNVELNDTNFPFDEVTYESYVSEYENLYFCSLERQKVLKKKRSMVNLNDELFAQFDLIMESFKTVSDKLMKTLHELRLRVRKVKDLVEGTTKVGEYRLVQISERLEQMTAAPGAMFAFSGVFHYLEDSDLVTVIYEINDRPVDFCEESGGGCSKIIFLYWLFFRQGGSYWDLLRYYFYYFPSGCSWLVSGRVDNYARLYMEFWKCLCYSSFGTHRFVFHRLFYNATTGKTTVQDIPHPHAMYIAPRPNELFSGYRNTSSSTRDSSIESCWGSHIPGPPEHPCNLHEPWIKDSMNSFWWWDMAAFIGGTLAWTWVLLIGLLFLPFLLGGSGRRLILGCEFFSRPRLLPPDLLSLGGLASRPTTSKLYDVYISYAEEQSDLAEDGLAPALEARGLGAFLRKRDTPLGAMEHAERVRAIDQSRKFLVVVSPDYVQDPLLNDHEFQYILALVHDGLVDQRDVLLYLTGICHLPHVLHAYPRLDATSLGDLDLLMGLRAWALRVPVTLPGWRSWLPSLPAWICGGVCVLALYLAYDFLHDSPLW